MRHGATEKPRRSDKSGSRARDGNRGRKKRRSFTCRRGVLHQCFPNFFVTWPPEFNVKNRRGVPRVIRIVIFSPRKVTNELKKKKKGVFVEEKVVSHQPTN